MRYITIGSGDAAREVSAVCLGALPFGSTVDEETSYAILDRYVAAGGSFIDTANNYAFWVPGCRGGESETVLGRWRKARDIGDEVVIATKLGAQPRTPGAGLEDAEGLSAAVVRKAAAASRERLGRSRIDLLYAHIEDRSVPLAETLGALDEQVREGSVGLLGVSNHAVWRLERARATSAAYPLAEYQVLQYRYSYLQPRLDIRLPEAGHTHVTPELLDYLRDWRRDGGNPVLVAYTALLFGAYTRADKRLPEAYDHPGTPRRLAAIDEVVRQAGATRNQVVLAWLLGHEVAVIPLIGVTNLGQLDEALDAVDLTLTPAQREHLDTAA